MARWTENKVKDLLKRGKIRSYRLHPKTKRQQRKRFLQRKGKEKYWMELNLSIFCSERSLELIPEYQFLLNRRFRFDWAIPVEKIGIEYEGIFSEKSRHTNPIGYSKDTEKYREAAKTGWIVLRYTALNYKDLLQDLKDINELKK